MSNEELAMRIQSGERELIPQLWEQVKGFVSWQARRRYMLTGGLGGVEIEDLAQSGFLALIEAVDYFKPDGEYKFLTCLGICLKTAFAEAGGYRTSKVDPLNNCLSLDLPLGDDPDGDTLLDLQADPTDPTEAAERRIWLEQLRTTLDRAMQDLTEEERDLLHRRYWEEQTLEEIAGDRGVTSGRIKQQEQNAFQKLRYRKYRSGLAQFVEEHTPYYTRVGVDAFHATHTSAVEKIVLTREKLEREYLARED